VPPLEPPLEPPPEPALCGTVGHCEGQAPGGAHEAAELDAKRAIDQGMRLATPL
jgi:hypothetical protein